MTGQVIGDIDCATQDKKYVNVAFKKVILYIDEPMVELSNINAKKVSELRELGVEIVNGLDELKGVFE